ncbi:MAG: hypothetical protein A2Z68_02185 [Candidatus Nealsonbacteria bacterium RBG_13_38_11]|uniref:Methyltransferase domain-containing protein n=1 Tax=Candidatus Nealsonbacteria bacterium RBG_13_38_11 TaxID=1801662 RepID=A0A1G2DZK5_9BACT|nr:MAG: hypothetical protein A2Z68_02185 [Candidatus Nealsonbacteria bacterium RBG_13_38_11]HXK31897.1 methyltransferase domain-containing protein [Candidatus Paceibacterota bacterium]
MKEFLDPEKILQKLKLEEDMIAADFGSGSGGWAIPLARKLEYGKVFAIDVLEEPLSSLEAKAKLAKISNIKTILADIETGSKVWDYGCDLVLMTNLLFQCEDKKKVLEEGKRVLKKGGRILVVDWAKDTALVPKDKIISPTKVKEIARNLGLKAEKEFAAGPYHFGLVLVK